jgi:SAM-dependent methyltransferase
VSEHWGYDRGTPIDRLYIERFLAAHAGDIHGRVLEVKDDGYSRRFGSNLQRVDVLDVDEANSYATVTADLADARALPDAAYDCFVLTQTLQYVPALEAAIGHAHRVLAPGGVLLVTVPALSRVVVGKAAFADHWRFTEASCRSLFGRAFAPDNVDVSTYGNAVAGAAFLLGYAAEELSLEELETPDERFPVLVAVRAVRR